VPRINRSMDERRRLNLHYLSIFRRYFILTPIFKESHLSMLRLSVTMYIAVVLILEDFVA
jgi:hypothetical protein